MGWNQGNEDEFAKAREQFKDLEKQRDRARMDLTNNIASFVRGCGYEAGSNRSRDIEEFINSHGKRLKEFLDQHPIDITWK